MFDENFFLCYKRLNLNVNDLFLYANTNFFL